jgi:hypothetical protein
MAIYLLEIATEHEAIVEAIGTPLHTISALCQRLCVEPLQQLIRTSGRGTLVTDCFESAVFDITAFMVAQPSYGPGTEQVQRLKVYRGGLIP